MLKVVGLSASYGEARVLRDVAFEINQGEVVTLVGRNGAGKTTILRCLTGLHKEMRGQLLLEGSDIAPLAPHARARRGLGYVPDDRGVYASLSVEENLQLPPTVGPDAWSMERVYEFFPVLKARRRFPGTKLSGGEQQMLAIARVLRMGARLLLLDEPTEGLAPVLVQQIGAVLKEVKAQGVTILLIEQNLFFATNVADRHYLLAQGQIVEALDNREVKNREHQLLEYLGV
ncbi:MAG: Branched-chain amino acid transport ATP-binding protein LivF [uncultured Chloroflexia bacterium]|uniref:Branched-chain amino acid transport ATP-binding protein LivF n=1 Tax=uncultured Chloroflexia bacterium TaxID=1672391 RepID=A0A6J4I9E3_9CHLR|nr:MAG: Branched-chain amino acid transport ATP-binding protein LivF [uncultured Chloroflexia bacterium]